MSLQTIEAVSYPLWMRDSSYEPVGTAVCRSHHLWYSRALNDLFLANYGAPDKPCGVGCADANPKTMLPNDT